MSNEQIHLEKITWDNYNKICKLRVTKEQDNYVARNACDLEVVKRAVEGSGQIKLRGDDRFERSGTL